MLFLALSMPYKKKKPQEFSFEKDTYEDYASGRVLYGMPGASAFPVRMASDVFEQAVHLLKAKGVNAPYVVYDPFCSGAYLLTVLGFLYGKHIKTLLGSDIDPNVLTLAAKNLSLLTKEGMERRTGEIERMIAEFKKDSHRDALESAKVLSKKISEPGRHLEMNSFVFDALHGDFFSQDLPKIDLVITDLPFQEEESDDNFAQLFLTNIKKSLNPNAIVCLSSNKKQPAQHNGYNRITSLKQVKRKVLFLEVGK